MGGSLRYHPIDKKEVAKKHICKAIFLQNFFVWTCCILDIHSKKVTSKLSCRSLIVHHFFTCLQNGKAFRSEKSKYPRRVLRMWMHCSCNLWANPIHLHRPVTRVQPPPPPQNLPFPFCIARKRDRGKHNFKGYKGDPGALRSKYFPQTIIWSDVNLGY